MKDLRYSKPKMVKVPENWLEQISNLSNKARQSVEDNNINDLDVMTLIGYTSSADKLLKFGERHE